MSIIKHVTLQKIVAHDFRYDSRTFNVIQFSYIYQCATITRGVIAVHQNLGSPLHHTREISNTVGCLETALSILTIYFLIRHLYVNLNNL